MGSSVALPSRGSSRSDREGLVDHGVVDAAYIVQKIGGNNFFSVFAAHEAAVCIRSSKAFPRGDVTTCKIPAIDPFVGFELGHAGFDPARIRKTEYDGYVSSKLD